MTSRTPIAILRAAAALSLGTSFLFSACAGNPTCADYGDCPGQGGNGGDNTGGDAGRSGSGDGGLSGADGENSGAGGTSAESEAGASGMAGAAGEPCSGDCGGATPICNAETNRCVACLERGDCKASKPACDTASHSCVECLAASDCPADAKPFCDKPNAKCVACLKAADCSEPAASVCKAGSCTACSKDADCSNIAGKNVCDGGACVQCTGKKFAACGVDGGAALVCDSVKRSCTTNRQQSAGLCQPCVTDAQCKAGQTCALDAFGSPAMDVGYFCHWKKGDVANGAPSDCFATGKPYSATRANVTSIDGDVSDLCTLAVSTCIAANQFKSKDCAASSAANDSACGVAPPKDAKCAQVPASSSFRCTMTCLSDEDCPGTTCDTGAAPRVCSFN